MTLGVGEVAMVWTAGSIIGSALFWGVLLLGRLTSRLERAETRLDQIDHAIDRAGQRVSDLTDEVQKMPDKFLTRTEALMWRGSRAEDRPPT